MNEKAQWGLLLVIYVLAAIPLMIKSGVNDARELAYMKRYPGRVPDQRQSDRLNKLMGTWVGGLVALLLAYEAGWSPIVAATILFGVILSMLVVRFALRRWAAGKHIVPQERTTTLGTQTNISVSQKIRDLQGLRNDELITEEEYQKKKQQLLEEL